MGQLFAVDALSDVIVLLSSKAQGRAGFAVPELQHAKFNGRRHSLHIHSVGRWSGNTTSADLGGC
jgi:hypothetical protein